MLLFDISGQTLLRTDNFKPAANSTEYLKAKFTFKDSAWNGKGKTAFFRIKETVYSKVLDSSGTCIVPWEVLALENTRYARMHGGWFTVWLEGVSGNVTITTNEVIVDVKPNGGGEVETPSVPTAGVYEQILTGYGEVQQKANTNAANIANANNIFCNALKGNVSGECVFVDDVSPVAHNPVVKVHGKNLLSIPDTTVEGNYAWCNVEVGSFLLKPGTYTISANYVQSGTSKIAISARRYAEITVQHGSNSSTNTSGRITLTFTIPEDDVGFTLYAYSNVTATATDSRCVFTNFQIEAGSVATEYTPYIDASTVELTRCGKAVFSKSSQVVSGVEKPWASLLLCAIKCPPGDYVAHCRFKQTGQDKSTVSISARAYNDYTVPFGDVSSAEIEGYLTKQFSVTPGSGGFQIFLYSNTPNEALTTECYFENICVEAGKTATKYTVYNGAKYTPNADGTVDNVSTLSPNMTMYTDTEGVVVELEYNRDINTVIDKIMTNLNI